MDEITWLISNTWRIDVAVSSCLFLWYWLRRGRTLNYDGIASVLFCVEGILALLLLSYQAMLNSTCYSESLERICILVGAVGAILQCFEGLKRTLTKSQPH